jgi:AbiV family abortive infection protein
MLGRKVRLGNDMITDGGLTDERQEKPSRSARLLAKRRICFQHADDLIKAAERALSEVPSLPNIAFHLTLLAIEEMGKAGLISSREVAAGNRDTGWIDKRLDDHAFKVLWGLWTPEMNAGAEVSPERFEQLKRFAQKAHLQRLDALYVDEALDDAMTTPKDAVRGDEALSLLNLAKQNLEFFEDEGSPDVDASDEVLDWFWETMSDEMGQKRLFSGPFMAKYKEFKNTPREWVRWAREEFDKVKKAEQALLHAELARTPDDENARSTLRWRLNVRIYCVSHSIRPRLLNSWNEKVPLGKLKFVKSSEMLLELTLGDHINLADIHNSGMSLSKLIICCLNIGTAGFFWYEMPPPSTGYFQKIEDLANPSMKVDIAKGFDLQRHWLKDDKRTLTVLEDTYLENAAKCAVVFGPMPDAEAAPIFGAYLHGLTLLGKSDMHLSLDNYAFAAFDAALRNALKHFGDWTGDVATLVPTLHKVLSDVLPEAEYRDSVLAHFLRPPSSHEEMQDYTIAAKRVADLYLVIVAHRLWGEKISQAMKAENNSLDVPEFQRDRPRGEES